MRKIFFSLVLLALFLLPAAPAFAQGGPGDGGNGRVVIGQDFVLKSGDTIQGDLVVIGGQVSIEQGATVYGDTVVIGGSLTMDGKATGNAVVIGGVVNLGSQSSVAGDLVTIGGALSRAEGSQVGGNVVTNLPPPRFSLPVVPTAPQAAIPPATPGPGIDFIVRPFATAGSIIIQAIGLAALAMLLTIFLHPQLDRVAQAVTKQPLISGSIGVLTVLLAPITLVILVVTVLLIPVALAAVVLLVLAWLFGVVAFGMEVGDRFTKAIHRTWEPVLSTGVGTFLLVVAIGIVNLVPCVGWLAPVIVGLVGLGAAVSTLFGTRMVPGPAPIIPVAPSSTEASIPPAS